MCLKRTSIVPTFITWCAAEKLFAGDVRGAQKDYLASNAIIEVLFQYGNLQSVMRAAMSFMGIDAGYNPSPFTEKDQSKLSALKAELKELRARLDIEPIDLLEAVAQ